MENNKNVRALRATTDADLISAFLDSLISDSTRQGYRLSIDTFTEFLGSKSMKSATIEDALAFRDHLADMYSNVRTQNMKLNSVKSMFSFAFSFGYLDRNIFLPIKSRKAKEDLSERILTEEEVFSIIDCAGSERNKLLILLMYASGARVSEMCSLKWSDVQPSGDSGQVLLFGKERRTRVVKLSQKTWDILREYGKGKSRNSPVFVSQKGGRLDESQVMRIVRKAAETAGIGKVVSPHWLRHSHASHAIDRGAPITLVRDTLGHSNVSVTSKYLHSKPDQSSAMHLAV